MSRSSSTALLEPSPLDPHLVLLDAGRPQRRRLADAFEAGLTPSPRILVPEWAVTRRYFDSKSGAARGKFDPGVVPYMNLPMECMSVRHPAKLVSFMGPSQSGKALALDTLLPLAPDSPRRPNDFTSVRRVKVGDILLTENHVRTRVVATSEVFRGHDCFEVYTDHGNIVVDADHRWTIVGDEGREETVSTARLWALCQEGAASHIPCESNWSRVRIQGVRPVASVPTRCLAVDNPTHLFLAGPRCIPTHNTDTLIVNTIGYRIECAPVPIVYIAPTVEMVEKFSRTKLDPMLEGTPALAGRVAERKSRDSKNTVRFKDFPNGFIAMVGSNSPAGLRQTSAGLLIADDLDAFATSAGKEGDPWRLARRRQASFLYFGGVKALAISSPNAPSRTLALVLESDWIGVWVEPCPRCEFPIELLRSTLKFDRPKRIEDIGEELECAIECPQCKRLIPDSQQHPMLDAGYYRVDRARPEAQSYGFRLPGLCARFQPWRQTAAELAKVEISQDRPARKVVLETMFAEEDLDPTEVPGWEGLHDRREEYPPAVVPRGGLVLVAGADVQKDRIEVTVLAIGRGCQIWVVDVKVFPGETTQEEVWDLALTPWFMDDYATAWKKDLPITVLALDHGYTAKGMVERWARKFAQPSFGRPGAMGSPGIAVRRPRTVMLVKGTGKFDKLISMAMKASATEKARGLRIVKVDDGRAKDDLYQRLRLEVHSGHPYPRGWVHFPLADICDEDYFQQLTSEVLVVRGVSRRYEKIAPHVRNEKLDCFGYALAAADAVVSPVGITGVDRWAERDWAAKERQLGVEAFVPVVPGERVTAVVPVAVSTPVVVQQPPTPPLVPVPPVTTQQAQTYQSQWAKRFFRR